MGFAAGRGAGVEDVSDVFLVESDEGDDCGVVVGEPADDPDCEFGVVGVGDSPEVYPIN